MSASDGKTIEILLVEDNPADVELTRAALREGKVNNNLSVILQGNDVMPYLCGQLPDTTRPDLILLDLNLPGKDGREVLSEMRADPELADIPVVILTTSDADADIMGAYQLNASAYITKPVDFDQFIAAIQEIDSFRVKIVHQPAKT